MVNIPVNKYQTEITDELLNSLPKEVQDQLLEIVNTVPFVRSLIDPNRQYARIDLEMIKVESQQI